MIRKIIMAVVVAVVVALVCLLIGVILTNLNVPVVEPVGQFLKMYSGVFGLLAGVWYYFAGTTL